VTGYLNGSPPLKNFVLPLLAFPNRSTMPQEHRIFVTLTAQQRCSLPATIQLTELDGHHLANVLRLPIGAPIIAVDIDTHSEYLGSFVRKTSEESVASVVLTEQRPNKITKPRVACLALAIIKGDHNDLVCEKATELGISNLIVYQAERSVVRVNSAGDIEKKIARWQRIAESAAKQSHQVRCPTVLFASGVAQMLESVAQDRSDSALSLICSLSASAKPLREVAKPEGQVNLIVGPEGDFTQSEEGLILAAGSLPVSLGTSVLRSETAAIAAVAMVAGLWGEITCD